MPGKCCCGCCSLYTGTGIALAIAAAEAVVSIFINTELLLLISQSKKFNPTVFLIDVDTIEDFDVFHGIVLAALGLNAFWLAFGIIAAIGNCTQSHGRLTPWVYLTYLLSLFYFGVSVYFAIKFQNVYSESPIFFDKWMPTKTLTYLTLLSFYSGGGTVILLNFYLAHIVEMRGKEIDKDYSALMLYILSHMNRCSQFNSEMEQTLLPEAPPSYDTTCPPYLPPEIFARTNESSGSSWSLSCEALKTISTGQLDELSAIYNINSERRNMSPGQASSSLMGRSGPVRYHSLNANTDDPPVLS